MSPFSVEQTPAADDERVVAVVPDRNVFDAVFIVVWMDEGADDAGRWSPVVV